VFENDDGPSESRLARFHLKIDIQAIGPLELLVSEPLRSVSDTSVFSSKVKDDFERDFFGRMRPLTLGLWDKDGTDFSGSAGEIGA
jgi:hypothetical protein